jgi:hypothetical protein
MYAFAPVKMSSLYPPPMLGHHGSFPKGELPPPRKSMGIHTAHVFLGNDPLIIRGCNIMRQKGFPEAAVMLVEDKQVCWLLATVFSTL